MSMSVSVSGSSGEMVAQDFKARLLGSQLEPFLSSYLMNGFRLDSLRIESVEVSGASIEAYGSLPTYFPARPLTNDFSLSFHGALALAVQVGTAHVGALTQQSSIDEEPKVEKWSLEAKREVTDSKNIVVRMEITESDIQFDAERTGFLNATYTWKVDIADGALVGELKLRLVLRQA